MKNFYQTFAMVIIACSILFGCSKKADVVTPVTPSTWNMAGFTYTGADGRFAGNTLGAGDTTGSVGSVIYIFFNAKPTSAGVYTIVSSTSDVINAGQCGIEMINDEKGFLVSASGGNAAIAVNNGKVTVTFNNITMDKITSQSVNTGYTFAPVGIASGVIIEK